MDQPRWRLPGYVTDIAGAGQTAISPNNAEGRKQAIAGIVGAKVLARVKLEPVPAEADGHQAPTLTHKIADGVDLPLRRKFRSLNA
jgi:hypothetical protein